MMIKVAVSDCFKLKMIPSFRSVFFPEKQEIHYIGGTDILPLPLSSEEEGHAISLLGGGQDEEGKKLLIEHNLRLVVYIAKKFDNTGVGVEDLISIGTIGLIKAINTFNPEKNIKLATYASRCIENEILMYLRRNNKTKLEVSIDEPLNVDWDGNELLLSDILGTEEDTIYRDMETEAEHKLLGKAIGRLSNRETVISYCFPVISFLFLEEIRNLDRLLFHLALWSSCTLKRWYLCSLLLYRSASVYRSFYIAVFSRIKLWT